MVEAEVTIRKAKLSDLEDLLELLNTLFSIEEDFSFNKEVQRRGLRLLLSRQGEERQVFAAERNGRVVGMCSIQTLISTAEGGLVGLVEDVVVRDGHRGNGIGNGLMEAVDDWARRWGLKRLQLLADKENRPALKFYESRGWKITQLIGVRKFPVP
jgi:GNAT superfamily N-acetyltransferase